MPRPNDSLFVYSVDIFIVYFIINSNIRSFHMKNRCIVFSFLTLILSLCSVSSATAFETRGSALMPCVDVRYNGPSSIHSTYISVTNITGSEIDCRVKFRDHAGDDVTSYCTVLSGNSSGIGAVTISTGTGLFTLPAGETRLVRLAIGNTSRYIIGHATIEWSSVDPNLRKAIVAHGYRFTVYNNRGAEAAIPVNNGLPF